MKKIASIIIIGLIVGCSFVVQGIFYERTLTEKTNNNINDIIFDQKIQLFMKLAKFPSLSACIIDGNEVTWSEGYGFYNLENRKPATENTVYIIASVTKTVTGTALMQLWEQGLFDLDEDVNNYLPFNLRNPHFPNDPITFRMLLSHSSSLNSEISENSFKYYFWFNFSDDPPFSFYPYPWLEEHLIPGGKWYYPNRWSNSYRPGQNAMYANVNFDLVAYLVEIISGELFLEYCNEHIFIPLKMYNTSFNLSSFNIEQVAIPYHWHIYKYIHINELSYYLREYTPQGKYWRMHTYPVGGLYTTISDLSHFLIAHMNDGVWDNVRILKKTTVDEMHRIQPGNKIGYGLAWQTGSIASNINITYSGHRGGTAGVHCRMFYTLPDNIGVIYVTNGDTYWELFQKMRSMILENIVISFLEKGGVNLFSYIDFENIEGDIKI